MTIYTNKDLHTNYKNTHTFVSEIGETNFTIVFLHCSEERENVFFFNQKNVDDHCLKK